MGASDPKRRRRLALPILGMLLLLSATFIPLYLASGSDRSLRLPGSPDALPILLGDPRFRPAETVRYVRFLPDGKSLATLGERGELTVWRIETGEILRREPTGCRYADRFILSSDGSHLAALAHGGGIYLGRTAGGGWRRLGEYVGWPGGLAFSPDGRTLAASNWAGSYGEPPESLVRLFDVKTGEPRSTLRDPSGQGLTIAYGSDPDTLFTAAGTTIRKWSVERQTSEIFLRVEADSIPRLLSDPGGRYLAWSARRGNDWRLGLLDLREEGEPGPRTLLESGEAYGSLGSFSRDGGRLACTSRAGGIRILDVESGEEVSRTEGGNHYATSIDFSSDGEMIVAADGHRSIRFLEVRTGKPLHERAGHRGAVQALAVLPGGRQVLSAGADGRLIRWELATRQPEILWEEPQRVWAHLSLSEDGSRCVLAGKQVHALVLDLEERSEVWRLEMERGQSRGSRSTVLLSGSGRFLAYPNETLRVRDLDGRKTEKVLELSVESRPVALRFSSDETRIFTLADATWSEMEGQCLVVSHPRWALASFDVGSGRLLKEEIRDVEFYVFGGHLDANGGGVVVGGSEDGISVFGIDGSKVDLEVPRNFRYWAGDVPSFSADGQLFWIANRGNHWGVVLDAGSGELLHAPDPASSPIRGSLLTSNGRHVILGCEDGSISIRSARDPRPK